MKYRPTDMRTEKLHNPSLPNRMVYVCTVISLLALEALA